MGELPTRLGRYIVEAELGRGGMGVVYLGHDDSLDRKVAIKVLPEEMCAHPDRINRFVREARTLASLNHPNIASVYGLDKHLGQMLLVMEYVPGLHLGQRLRETPALTMDEALTIAFQIAAGLEAAHDRGVVHRDMKPANVRVTPGGVVKVLDFGLAKSDAPIKTIADEDETRSFVQTETGRVVGTAGYMSPEQARGKPVDKRADIWSFGAVLYETLAGSRAFPGETPMDAIVAVIEKEPDWARLPDATPDGVAELIAACLTKDPAKRLRDIGDARREIELALASGGGSGSLPNWGSTVGGSRGFSSVRSSMGSARSGWGSGSRRFRAGGSSVPGSRASNLPASLNTFIGRRIELAAVERLIGSARLVTLAGAGGVGKTRLAMEAAKRMETDIEAGVWWIDVAQLKDPEVLLQQIATTLGTLNSDAADPADTVANAVNDREVLILLDNCEAMRDAVARACDTMLAICPGMRVVVTSREPLGVAGETLYRVPVMGVPAEDDRDLDEIGDTDGVKLFLDRAAAVRPGFQLDASNATAIAEICRCLDGIPLAIELAASRTKVLSPQQIVERLEDRFKLLGGGRRSSGGRHRALETAIAWSFDQLDPDEAAAFRRLSVFCGGVTLSGAEAVCYGPVDDDSDDIEPWEAIDLISQLVDKSMITVDEDAGSSDDATAESRYTMLETVRQYGLRKLTEAGELGEMRRRHLAWLAELAKTAEPDLIGPNEAAWRRRLVAERGNIRAALDYVLRNGGDLELGRVIGAGVWRSMAASGAVAEGRKLLSDLERLSAGSAPTPAWAKLRSGIAWMSMLSGDLTSAVMFGRASLEMARMLGDEHATGVALLALGAACQGEGLADRAVDYLEEALAIYREAGETAGVAECRARLGDALREMGREDEAAEHFKHALSLTERDGASATRAAVLSRSAWFELRRGRIDLAAERARDAAKVLQRCNADAELPDLLELFACLCTSAGQLLAAERLFAAASAARIRFGTPASLAHVTDITPFVERASKGVTADDHTHAREEGGKLRPYRALLYALEEYERLVSIESPPASA